jgi:MSHA biogenesis protein MshL
MNKVRLLLLTLLLLPTACVQTPQHPSAGHLLKSDLPDNGHLARQIPAPVSQMPVVPEPTPAVAQETFSVVVTDVPLDQLLFTLARDAKINVDVHPGLSGHVTLNAIDQTLLQILDRIAAQVPIRYHFEDQLLVVEPDQPYLRSYYIDYVNLTRSSSTENSISTQISTSGGSAVETSGGGGSGAGSSDGNNSSTSVRSASDNQFWSDLKKNIAGMLGLDSADAGTDISVIVSSETGLLTVRATHKQQLVVQEYLDRMMHSAKRQVLIEATVVEVELNKNYQFGVDWSAINDNGTGISFNQALLGPNLNSPPVFTIDYLSNTSWGTIASSVKMLQEFGDVKVLSSPKIMAINNQTALLKVVDNVVYFTIESDTLTNANSPGQTTFTTTPHTVAVGFFMSVTPQISREDAVILNVRPTISRVTGFVNDPNPELAESGTVSRIPQIQVREMESVLRVRSGQMAVLGGLIQDTVDLKDQGIPGLTSLDVVGDAFTYRNNQHKKSELVIFLRPRVVASIDQPFDVYSDYLPDPDKPMGPKRASEQGSWN